MARRARGRHAGWADGARAGETHAMAGGAEGGDGGKVSTRGSGDADRETAARGSPSHVTARRGLAGWTGRADGKENEDSERVEGGGAGKRRAGQGGEDHASHARTRLVIEAGGRVRAG